MNILHYTIGLPPKRHGGSVQFAYDLIREQIALGHKVYAMTCGDTFMHGSVCRLKRASNSEIDEYKLTNPMTPTLLYGTNEPEYLCDKRKVDEDSFQTFIDVRNIQVLHIHTFMGLPIEVVELFKKRGVRIVYTTHDFFGLCVKNNLMDNENCQCEMPEPAKCAVCCVGAPSNKFLRMANSTLYHKLKQVGEVKKFFLPKKKALLSIPSQIQVSAAKTESYAHLIQYYRNCFDLVDEFHFNSKQTSDIFRKIYDKAEGCVIPVATSDIRDRRRIKKPDDKVRFAFIGSLNDYKGFPRLKRVLVQLYDEGLCNWELEVWGTAQRGLDADCKLIEYKGHYSYRDIDKVMCHLDGTIVPSKCHETFSLVTLEALSFGVPVIVSDTVGAKDIVRDIDPNFVFSSEKDLYLLLKSILKERTILTNLNLKICSKPWVYSMSSVAEQILDKIYCNDRS